MRTIYQDPYVELARWDMISRFSSIKSSKNIPSYQSLKLRLHEDQPRHYRDRHVQSFILELISGQRVSPNVISKGTYKKSLVVKKVSKSSQIEVTLRGKRLALFLLRWTSFAMPSAQYFRGLGASFSIDRNGSSSLYYSDLLSFGELSQFSIFIYTCNAVQLHFFQTRHTNLEQASYLLSVFHAPLLKESVFDLQSDVPALFFFRKN
jgi:ribosomal protein L5